MRCGFNFATSHTDFVYQFPLLGDEWMARQAAQNVDGSGRNIVRLCHAAKQRAIMRPDFPTDSPLTDADLARAGPKNLCRTWLPGLKTGS